MANAMSSSSSSSSGSLSTLIAQSVERRKKIKADVDEADDPLALYDNHLTWTLDKFPPTHLHVSGVLEFLEEGTRYFLSDTSYKGDLRYLRLWTTYALLVDKPSTVFKFVLSHGIGTSLARLYEEYALALERENRHSAAEQVLEAGLKRKARPTARLSKALDAFRQRISTVPRASPPAASVSLPRHKGTPETDLLRSDPLKFHNAGKSSSSKSAAKATTSSSTSTKPSSSTRSAAPAPTASSSASLSLFTSTSVEERYAVIRAPALPTKRPERLRADLSLLFPDGKLEYNISEVRARSSRYKPREPSPPPPPAPVHHPPQAQYSPARSPSPDSPEISQEITTDLTRQIDFNDDGTKSSKRFIERRMERRSIGFSSEPTVTINTKAALMDVFGMYNSPDKSVVFDNTPGGKHAPVRKIDVIPPPRFDLQPQTPSNPPVDKTPGSIKPYVDDENAGRKENAGSLRFKPFVDNENPPRANAFTPGSARKAFSVKETPAKTPGNTSKVFTPAGSLGVFRAQSTEAKTPAPMSLKPAFTPLAQATPSFRVFSHPSENAGPTPVRGGAFTPFIDENAGAPTPSRTPLGERQPLRSAFAMTQEPLQEEEEEEEEEEVEYSLREEEDEEEYGDEEAYPVEQQQYIYVDQQAEYVDEHDDELPRGHKTPLGGRFGKFDVMTPITERTYEYTGSSHGAASVHSSGGTGRFFNEPDAVSAAARLAAEVRADTDVLPSRPGSNRMLVEDDGEEEEYAHEDELGRRRPPPFRLSDGHTIDGPSLHEQHAGLTAYVEERTGTLSLSDALDAAHRVHNVPNPCNPFDPPIIASLLATIDPDDAHFDFARQDAAQLDGLQRFARKKARGSDGDARGVNVVLGERRFMVYEKLGEGGFGAVFAAKELKSRLVDDDEDDEDLDDEDEDDDEDEANSRFALKIVKPRNLWEFYILRRVHATLPPELCASVVLPHALYSFRDESFLMLSLCTQGSLLDIINKAPAAGIAQQGACLDELLVVFFTIELMRLLGGLHSAGIIHGDLKIDNCLLRLEDAGSSWSATYDPSGSGGWDRKGVSLIDFGRAIDTQRFPEDQTFIAEWATDARDCAEMRAGKPWTYHADYFGLAGIVFCMLFGRYIDAGAVAAGPDGRARLVTPLKRYWQTELWTRLFDMLLNPAAVSADGALPIVNELAEVRGEFERWLVANCMRSSNTLKGLLKKVELSLL